MYNGASRVSYDSEMKAQNGRERERASHLLSYIYMVYSYIGIPVMSPRRSKLYNSFILPNVFFILLFHPKTAFFFNNNYSRENYSFFFGWFIRIITCAIMAVYARVYVRDIKCGIASNRSSSS